MIHRLLRKSSLDRLAAIDNTLYFDNIAVAWSVLGIWIREFVMAKFRCTLAGCNKSAPNGPGLSAHQRAHVMRGEANFIEGSKTNLVPTGNPICQTSVEIKRRMEAIRRGDIKASLATPTRHKDKTTAIVLSKRKYTKKQENQTPIIMNSPMGLTSLNRLKDAVVLATVSDMLETIPAEQMLHMLAHIKSMPQAR